MKVVEIMKMGSKTLELLQKSCINVSDVRYVPLYEEYLSLRAKGNKMSYISAYLAERYGVSERKVYYLIKRLGSECKILAEG